MEQVPRPAEISWPLILIAEQIPGMLVPARVEMIHIDLTRIIAATARHFQLSSKYSTQF